MFPAEALARELMRARRARRADDRRARPALRRAPADVASATASVPASPAAASLRAPAASRAGRGVFAGRAAAARRCSPRAVVGFGGYASVPTVLAARRAPRVPALLHEQNAVLGRANRLLAPRRRAHRALSFADTAARAGRRAARRLTGNPVRAGDRRAARAAPIAPPADGGRSASW